VPQMERNQVAIQNRTLAVLCTSSIASRGALSALFTVAALSMEEMLDSSRWAGLSTVAITVGSMIAAAMLATLMDRSGRRPGITYGYLAAAAGSVVAITGLERDSVVIFLAGLILVGVGSGTANLSRYAAADLAPPELRSTHISWVIFASTAGSVGGPLLVGLAGAGAISLGLTENSGAIGIGLVAFAVAAALVWVFMRPDPLLVAREMGHSATQQKRNFSQAITIIWNSPMARLALASLVISQAVMVMVMAMTPLHMKAHDHSLTMVGAVISAHTAGMYAFAPIAGWFSDRFGRIKAIGVGSAILLLATIITALATTAPNALMFPGLYLLGLGWSFGIVAGSALLTESVNSEHRVSVQGAADFATNLASGLGALASGLVFDMSGFHTLSLIGTVGAGLLMLHGFWRYRLAILG
jgi:MFS family permease